MLDGACHANGSVRVRLGLLVVMNSTLSRVFTHAGCSGESRGGRKGQREGSDRTLRTCW